NNLDDSRVPAAQLSVIAKPAMNSAGFGGIETPAATISRRAISTTGGFGSSEAGAAAGSHRGSIASGGFGDAAVATATPAARKLDSPAAATAVEILSKPKPAYTAEARALHIEGEVLVEIEFAASGELRVLRVARGLGHGLDESAVAAAREIRFRPARRAGASVDSTALVHIQFQLAY
ncbi:MAG TPA: energy transducer TonB, partial [Bryobacteraceae bacterium]|nr:energy transducer TonB [Bryobacteraceae bacterium]